MPKKYIVALIVICINLTGCIAVKVVDTAIDTTVGVSKVAVKTTGKVVGAALPDSDNEEE